MTVAAVYGCGRERGARASMGAGSLEVEEDGMGEDDDEDEDEVKDDDGMVRIREFSISYVIGKYQCGRQQAGQCGKEASHQGLKTIRDGLGTF